MQFLPKSMKLFDLTVYTILDIVNLIQFTASISYVWALEVSFGGSTGCIRTAAYIITVQVCSVVDFKAHFWLRLVNWPNWILLSRLGRVCANVSIRTESKCERSSAMLNTVEFRNVWLKFITIFYAFKNNTRVNKWKTGHLNANKTFQSANSQSPYTGQILWLLDFFCL